MRKGSKYTESHLSLLLPDSTSPAGKGGISTHGLHSKALTGSHILVQESPHSKMCVVFSLLSLFYLSSQGSKSKPEPILVEQVLCWAELAPAEPV